MRNLKHILSVAVLALAITLLPGCKTVPAQAQFTTPDQAAAALQQALKAKNQEPMHAIFGREWMAVCASGDAVADQHDREVVALAMDQSWHWAPRGDDTQELIIGDERWPFPVPLVKTGSEWRFDSQEGREEVLSRRIGGNELGVISICREYVRAQQEYASQSHDRKTAGAYAQHFRSAPGLQDGLYWKRQRGGARSPFEALVDSGIEAGYDPNKPDATPFRGYCFWILKAQGPAAPGGKRSYVVNGEMTGGFALLAYPAKYASSGVMTFIVGQDGVVYQKDFGKDTLSQATRLQEFNPDSSWTPVQAP
jgi:hypothetical protein